MKTEYDKELLNSLKDKIASEEIIVHNNVNKIVEEIESFYPMGFSGIDWLKSEYIFCQTISLNENKSTEILEFFYKIIDRYPELIDEKIIVIGDSLTELAYEVKFSNFLILFNHFFSIPQHTYVWFRKSRKCINLTFENTIYFG